MQILGISGVGRICITGQRVNDDDGIVSDSTESLPLY